MIENDPVETLTAILETDRDVYRYEAASESLHSSNFTTAANGMLAAMQPSNRYWTALAKRYSAASEVATFRNGGAICGGVLVVIVGVLSPGILEWLPSVIDIGLVLETASQLPGITRQDALLFVWLLCAGVAGAVTGRGLSCWVLRTHRPPQHGPTGSLYIGTAGDGTVTIDYQFSDTVAPTFETQLKEIVDKSQIQAETMTLDNRLGAVQPTDGDETAPWTDADRTPYVGQIVLKSPTPYEPLGSEPNPETLLEENDFGLPTDEIIDALATQSLPATVVVTAAAREHDPNRAERIGLSQAAIAPSRPEATAQLLESTRAGTDQPHSPAPANLFDISIRLLCFPTADETPEALCEELRNTIAGTVYSNNLTIDYQLFPVGTHSRLRLFRRRHSRVLLTRLRDETVPVRGLSQYFTRVPLCGFHVQPSLPVTGRGFWLYFGVTGKGLEEAANAQATTNLDQTETDTPPESVLQQLRKRVDGSIFAPDAHESQDAAHTGTGQTADPEAGAQDSAASNTASQSGSSAASATADATDGTPSQGGES
jgi:hypothetical protein